MRLCCNRVNAFELGDGSEQERAAIPSGSATVSSLSSYFGSTDPENTLTEFGVSELEAIARAKFKN